MDEEISDHLPRMLGCLAVITFAAGVIAAKIGSAVLSHLRIGWH